MSLFLSALIGALMLSGPAKAQGNVFDPGWTMQPGQSVLNFQSVKNSVIVETGSFASLRGRITPAGEVSIEIPLESVDTKVDLRNVRMRFMFFESFKFPTATVTATLDPAVLEDLPKVRRKLIDIPFVLDLHGVRRQLETQAIVTLLSEDSVAISTSEPISVSVEEFGLSDGLEKLMEASGFDILPSAFVSFDFMFSRDGTAGLPDVAVIRKEVTLRNSAVELEGNLDYEACKGRFEILSRTGNIYFGAGSASLQPDSLPLLKQVVDIVSRCPGMVIEVGGHTDADGGAAANLTLSQARARSVTEHLTSAGIDARRILSVGYGEASPVAPNDTLRNKAKNRRIEFAVVER
ncbi:OmpA family protein [Antarctobacter jejuensis]|uniref:OmpA family protein n=1 Tax=Antarctobacter jejuensis TaxID=1439938 RepID=UPI003FD6B207